MGRIRKWQLNFQKYPYFLAGIITTVFASLYNIIQVSIFPYTEQIAQAYQVSTNYIKFVSVLENGFLVGSIALLNVSIRRFSQHRCVVYGSFFVFIPNLIIGLVNNFWVFATCRVVQAVGYGFVLPTSVSLTNFLVKKDQEELGLTVGNIISQATPAIGVYLGSFLIKTHSFNYQIIIMSSIGIAYACFFSIFLPFPIQIVRAAKYNLIGVALASLGFSIFGAGVAYLATNGLPYQLEIAQSVMAFGFFLIIMFFVYNFKYCKHDITVSLQVFNKNSRHFMFGFCINYLIMFIIQSFDPMIWKMYYNVTDSQIKFLMNLSKVIQIFLIPLIVLVVKRIVVRQIATYNSVIMLTVCVLMMINRKIFKSIILQELCSIITIFIVQLNLTMGQMYNMRHSPKQFIPPTGTYLFVGVRSGVLLQQMCTYYILDLFDDQESRVLIMYVFCLFLSLLGLLLVKDLGIFEFERGKIGFSQQQAQYVETYSDLIKKCVDRGVDARQSQLHETELIVRQSQIIGVGKHLDLKRQNNIVMNESFIVKTQNTKQVAKPIMIKQNEQSENSKLH